MHINGLAAPQQTFEDISTPRNLTTAAGQSAAQDQRVEFGSAVVFESGDTATKNQSDLYGSNGRMREAFQEGAGEDGAEPNSAESAADSEDAALIEKLRQRDAHVRGHEMAHLMAADGQAQGTPQYTYQTGPDGRAYAIGGSVNISVTRTGDPEHDARQAETARRAATAVGDPSVQDSLTASEAQSMAGSARQRALNSYGGQDGYTRQPENSSSLGFMV